VAFSGRESRSRRPGGGIKNFGDYGTQPVKDPVLPPGTHGHPVKAGTSYALKLTDSTTAGNNISVTKTCAPANCVDTSAEWVSERPSFSIGIVPQAHYNAFKITNGSVTANGKTTTIGAGPGVNSITMIDATQTYNLNTVSALTGGNAFLTSATFWV
jgi:hypothetical protein